MHPVNNHQQYPREAKEEEDRPFGLAIRQFPGHSLQFVSRALYRPQTISPYEVEQGLRTHSLSGLPEDLSPAAAPAAACECKVSLLDEREATGAADLDLRFVVGAAPGTVRDILFGKMEVESKE